MTKVRFILKPITRKNLKEWTKNKGWFRFQFKDKWKSDKTKQSSFKEWNRKISYE